MEKRSCRSQHISHLKTHHSKSLPEALFFACFVLHPKPEVLLEKVATRYHKSATSPVQKLGLKKPFQAAMREWLLLQETQMIKTKIPMKKPKKLKNPKKLKMLKHMKMIKSLIYNLKRLLLVCRKL
ncbi:hypothetical protein L1887_23966 [Cichorium endivia]|nr:hypothetical protein L1887_23966 [Cichorium endivia]